MSTRDALESFSQGDIEAAKSILAQTASQANDMEEMFSAACMRAAIAAMEGSLDGVKSAMSGVSASNRAFGDSLTCYLQGLAHMGLGSYKQAKSMFLESKKKDPHFVIANIGIAAILFHEKQYKESFSNYREALLYLGSEKVPPVVRIGMSLCAYYLNDTTFALNALQTALKYNSDDELALLASLFLHIQKHNLGEISVIIQKLSKMAPSNPLVLLKYCDLLYYRACTEHNISTYFEPIKKILDVVRSSGSAGERALADFHDGRLCLAGGDCATAKSLLQSALDFYPGLLAARLHFANCFFFSGDIAKGMELLLQVKREFPDKKELLQLLAVYASECGSYELALQCARRLSTSSDVNARLLYLWCCRFNSGEYVRQLDQIIKLLKAIGKEVPFEMYSNRAAMTGDAEALQAILDTELGGNFETADQLDAKYVPVVYNLALLLEKSELTRAKAKSLYLLLVKQHGCFVPAYIRLHQLAQVQGSLKEAVSWLTLLTQVLDNEPIAQASLSSLFAESGEIQLSPKILDTIPDKKSTISVLSHASAFFEISQFPSYRTEKYLSKAKERFQYVLRQDKANLLAAHGLACCLGVEQKFELCQSLLKSIIEVSPNHEPSRRYHLGHMANIKTISESFKTAIDYAERENEKTPELNMMLAFCLCAEHQYDKAIEICEQVVAERPEEPMFSYNLSLLFLSAFNHGLSVEGSVSPEEGLKLRDYLQKGEEVAQRTLLALDTQKRSKTYRQSSVALRFAIKYSITQYKEFLQKKLVLSEIKAKEREDESKRWAETLQQYNDEIRRQQESENLAALIDADKRKRRGEEISESFAQRPVYIRTDPNGPLYAAMCMTGEQQDDGVENTIDENEEEFTNDI